MACMRGAALDGLFATGVAKQAFGNWFMSYLRLFRCHQQLWMMRSPTAICGFGVDRARAETLLHAHPSVRTQPPLPPQHVLRPRLMKLVLIRWLAGVVRAGSPPYRELCCLGVARQHA